MVNYDSNIRLVRKEKKPCFSSLESKALALAGLPKLKLWTPS